MTTLPLRGEQAMLGVDREFEDYLRWKADGPSPDGPRAVESSGGRTDDAGASVPVSELHPDEVCDNCDGTGITDDPDGSCTGTVGALTVCSCVLLVVPNTVRLRPFLLANWQGRTVPTADGGRTVEHLGSFEVDGPWGDER